MQTRPVVVQPKPPKKPEPKPVRPPERVLPKLGPKRIVVDAGHGGKDPGTRGVSPIPEKSFNLLLTMELRDVLARCGASPVMTRTTDRFIPLDGRASIARRNRADLFVSIHADWSRKRSVSGATVYIARKASRNSVRAAECLVAAFKQSGIECRGIRRRDFRVLVKHPRPAVLIECGYFSNARDAKLLNTANYRTRLVHAIVDGLAVYFGR
jgi:N-acetylmuramoyl-L-alanine amidase